MDCINCVAPLFFSPSRAPHLPLLLRIRTCMIDTNTTTLNDLKKKKRKNLTPPLPLLPKYAPPPPPNPPDFTGGGCATLTDMYNAQSGSGPLFVLDGSDKVVSGSPTGRWLLTSSLQILEGVTLYVHGTSAGGDADVLRIEVSAYLSMSDPLVFPPCLKESQQIEDRTSPHLLETRAPWAQNGIIFFSFFSFPLFFRLLRYFRRTAVFSYRELTLTRIN